MAEAKIAATGLDTQIVTPTGVVLRHRPEESEVSVALCPDCSKLVQKTMGKPMTVRSVCIEALCAVLDTKKKVSGKEKLESVLLAEKLITQPDCALSKEVCVDLKRRVNEAFANPTVVARVWQVLDPDEKVVEEQE